MRGARLVVALAGLLGATPATAARCDIGLVEFGSAITTVQLSVTNGYADGAAKVIDELHGNIECLRFAPPGNLWADWLFLVALTRHAQGREDWAPLLDRALALNPTLSRSVVGSAHPLARYEPSTASTQTQALPYDKDHYQVLVDGQVVDGELLDPDGFHLVQLHNGSWWDSMIIEGGAAAEGLWVPRRQPQMVRLTVSVVGGGGLAGDGWTESTSGASSSWQGVRGFGAVRGQLSVGRLALRGQLSPDESLEAPFFGVVGADWGLFGIGVGGAADRLRTYWFDQHDTPLDTRWYPDPVLAIWGSTGGDQHVDGRIMTTLTRQSGHVGFWPQRVEELPIRYRIGLAASRRSLALTQAVVDTRYPLRAWYVGAEVSVLLFDRNIAEFAPPGAEGVEP